jgi:hypothetical protein
MSNKDAALHALSAAARVVARIYPEECRAVGFSPTGAKSGPEIDIRAGEWLADWDREEERILNLWDGPDGQIRATERERLIVDTLRGIARIHVSAEALHEDLRTARRGTARKAHRQLTELDVRDPELAKGELNSASLAADAWLAMANREDERYFKMLKSKEDGRLSLEPNEVRDALREKKHEAPASNLRTGDQPSSASAPTTSPADDPAQIVAQREEKERLVAAIEAVGASKGARKARAGRAAKIIADHAKDLATGKCRVSDLARKYEAPEMTLRDEWKNFRRKVLKELGSRVNRPGT